MKELATYTRIKGIQDLRMEVAMLRLADCKGRLESLRQELASVSRLISTSRSRLRWSLRELLRKVKDPDHYHALPATLATRKLRHDEELVALRHERSRLQESIVGAHEAVRLARERVRELSGKQEKYKVLIERATLKTAIAQELQEEEDRPEHPATGVAHAR